MGLNLSSTKQNGGGKGNAICSSTITTGVHVSEE